MVSVTCECHVRGGAIRTRPAESRRKWRALTDFAQFAGSAVCSYGVHAMRRGCVRRLRLDARATCESLASAFVTNVVHAAQRRNGNGKRAAGGASRKRAAAPASGAQA